jgi:ion channel-forming bestrophin family protein
MSEEGGGVLAEPATVQATQQHDPSVKPTAVGVGSPLEETMSPMSPRTATPNPFSRKNSTLDLDDYFVRALFAHNPTSTVPKL